MPDDQPDEPSGDQPVGPPAPEDPARGRMRFRPDSTTPREAPLAERRAREVAARRAEEADEHSATRRRRILVGATVGPVAGR